MFLNQKINLIIFNFDNGLDFSEKYPSRLDFNFNLL